MDVIAVEGLTKSFGPTRALDGLDLRVRAGEVHGFLGPNGAGKSTTIRILLGLIRADGGRLSLFGGDPWRDATELHRHLAYVPGDVALWPSLTGGECIDLLAGARGSIDEAHRRDLVDRFGLDESTRCRNYSKGNRQKVALVAALAADADLLILDEPTSGLDPLMERVFQDVVAERTQAGAAVLLSSHILSEVETLADRVTIVRAGRTVTTATLADLRRHTRTTVRAVTAAIPHLTLEGVHDLVGADTPDGVRSSCHVDGSALAAVVGALHEAGVRTLTVEPPSLDEVFLRAYDEVAA